MIKINGDRMHPCLTPVYFKCLRQFSIMDNFAVEFLYICWISVMNFAGIS